MLGQRDFDLFKMDKRKKPEIIPVGSRDAKSLWELKYQGVYIVQQASVHGYTPFRQVAGNNVESSFITDLNQPGLANATDSAFDTQAHLHPSAGDDSGLPQLPPNNFSTHSNPLMPSLQPGIYDTTVVTSSTTLTTAVDDFTPHVPPIILSTQINRPMPSLQPNFSGDMIELSIVGKNITERLIFGKNCRPQDVYASVGIRFAISDFLLLEEDNREKVLPQRSNLTLAQWSIPSGTTYVVEEDVDSYLGHQPLQNEESSTDEDPEVTFRPVMNLQELHLRRSKANNAATTLQQLLLRRDHIVDDAVQQYEDTTILHHKIVVKFDGEKGEDLEGLTREFFSLFWQNWAKKLAGSNKLYISLNPTKVIGSEELHAVGKILMYGYILCGYLPYFVNASVLFWLLVGREPSSEMLFTEFMESLDEGDKLLVNTSLNDVDEISEEMTTRLGAYLAKYDFGVIPKKETLLGNLQALSKYITLMKPFFFLEAIRAPIKETAASLFGEITEDEFTALLKSFKPTGVEVVSRLRFKYSDEQNQWHLPMEERVADFLQTFLVSLNQRDLLAFVRFVSGCEILPQSILVEFNSESNEEMMAPSAHTCSVSLHISRYFLTYQSLELIFKNLLSNTSLWSVFDTI